MKINTITRICFVSFCIILYTSSINAQNNQIKGIETHANNLKNPKINQSTVKKLKSRYDNLYGLDYELYNGRRYYPSLKNDSGTPFWQGSKALYGKLVLSGNSYDSLSLLYDVYNHQFVLEYADINNNIQRIILIDSKIDTVEINHSIFIKNINSAIHSKYIQLLHQGNISCYIDWRKEYMFKNTGRFTGYQYSSDIKTLYLDIQGNLIKFNNNKSFLKAFEQEKRKLIRNYVAKKQLKIKKAELIKIKKLIEYCNSIF